MLELIYWRNNFHKFGPKWPRLHDYTNLEQNPTPIDWMVGFISNQRKTNITTKNYFNVSFPFGLVIPLPTPFPSFFFLLKFLITSNFSTFSKFFFPFPLCFFFLPFLFFFLQFAHHHWRKKKYNPLPLLFVLFEFFWGFFLLHKKNKNFFFFFFFFFFLLPQKKNLFFHHLRLLYTNIQNK